MTSTSPTPAKPPIWCRDESGPQTGIRSLGNVYLYDIGSGTTLLVSHATGAATTTANGTSNTMGTTGFGENQMNGRYLLFLSDATNLIAGQDNSGTNNLFMYDTVAQTTTLISHASSSATQSGNGETFQADISQDGKFIVYASLATNLVAGQAGNAENAFVYINQAGNQFGQNVLLSGIFSGGASSTTIGAGFVTDVAISADGSLVVFISAASDLVNGQSLDAGAAPSLNVFARLSAGGNDNLLSGANVNNATSSSVTSNGNALRLAISANGNTVAYISNATDLYPIPMSNSGPTVNANNVFLADLTITGTSIQQQRFVASFDPTQNPGNQQVVPAGGVVVQNSGDLTDLTISGNGQYVTYQEQYTPGETGHIVSGQTAPFYDNQFVSNSFVYDQATGKNDLLSRVQGLSATTGNANTISCHS